MRAPGRTSWRIAVASTLIGGGGAAFVAACLADLPNAPAGDASAGIAVDGGGGPVALGPIPRCGDGIVQRDAGEACDPGDAGSDSDAGVIGCTSCQIDCPEGGVIDPDNDHCYFTIGDLASRDEPDVATACAAAAGHIVSLSSDDERNEVNRWLAGQTGFYWVALHRSADVDKVPTYGAVGVNEPGWSSSCSGCYDAPHFASAKSFLDVCYGYRSVADCVAGSPTSDDWSGIDCAADCADAGTSELHVCEREPIGSSVQACDDAGASCLTIKSSASLYELVLAPPLNATDATRECALKHGASGIPGHLVVFDTAEERESISRELSVFVTQASPSVAYWVGLSRTSDSAGFTWADSASVAAHPLEWGNEQPGDGNFVFASISGDFDSQLLQTSDGSESRPYLCELE